MMVASASRSTQKTAFTVKHVTLRILPRILLGWLLKVVVVLTTPTCKKLLYVVLTRKSRFSGFFFIFFMALIVSVEHSDESCGTNGGWNFCGIRNSNLPR